jgi:hypothetical protein
VIDAALGALCNAFEQHDQPKFSPSSSLPTDRHQAIMAAFEGALGVFFIIIIPCSACREKARLFLRVVTDSLTRD